MLSQLEGKTMRLLLTMLLMTSSAFAQSNHHLYVVNKSADSISILNVATLEVEHTISVGRNPHELAVAPDGSKLYVGNAGGNSVSVVDLGTYTETKKITTPDFSPDSGFALVTSEQSRKIVIIDTATDEVVQAIDTDQGGTHMAAIDRAGEWAYFTNREANTVSFMDLGDFRIVANVAVGQGSEGFALSPDESEIWVSNRDARSISVIDVAGRSVVATLEAGERPNRVAFTPDGRHVLIPMGSGEVSVYDTSSREIIDTVPLGSAGGGIVASPDGQRVFVAAGGTNAIHIIDTGTWTVTGRVGVGSNPDGLAMR
jgi:YVTN family beta-propeller protein